MLNDLIIHGLNMEALNALIWASAVLAKLAVVSLVVGAVLWALLFIGTVTGLVVTE